MIMMTNMRIPCNILRENVAKHEGCQNDHLRVCLQAAGQLEDNVMFYNYDLISGIILFFFNVSNIFQKDFSDREPKWLTGKC